MKTLDETIAELEDEGLFADALTYLKLYRSDKAQYEIDREQWETAGKEAEKAWREARDKYIDKLKELDIGTLNDPLDWEELKQMEGKPVWVEYDDHFPGRKGTKFKEWEVINCIFDDRIVVKGDWDYHKSEQGDVWQAYRKERS